MKINYFLSLLLFSLIFQFCISPPNDEEKTKKHWEVLFKDYTKRGCRVSVNQVNPEETIVKSKVKKDLGLPIANKLTKDRFENKMGRDEVGYFFDYLDSNFKEPMLNIFKEIWTLAKLQKVPDNDKTHDDYDLIELNKKFSASDDNTSTATTIDINLQAKIQKYLTKEFDSSTYENSINMVQLNSFLKMWNYSNAKAKDMVDKFDMDGDGRLNVREFILFTIVMSRNVGDKKSVISYDTIYKDLIKPMYNFINCNGNDFILTEEIFNSLKFLKRNANTYDMYSCKTDDKALHSTAVNDFLLKNNKFKTGKMLEKEFSRGILLGYWDRLTTKLSIEDSDKLSEKEKRWKEEGKTDISCEELEEMKKLIN